jgi:hypothetical protein
MRREARTLGITWLSAVVVMACGGQTLTSSGEGNPPGNAPAPATAASVGGACIPAEESLATYPGADAQEVSFDSNSPACDVGDVCLMNHFQGRTSCPYGGASGTCTVPGTGAPVTVAVSPQCADRTAADAVYCSCRCANPDGRTDDGASYCTCPGSFSCVQLVSPIGQPAADSSAGAYCIKQGTQFDPLDSCQVHCDPTSHPCP